MQEVDDISQPQKRKNRKRSQGGRTCGKLKTPRIELSNPLNHLLPPRNTPTQDIAKTWCENRGLLEQENQRGNQLKAPVISTSSPDYAEVVPSGGSKDNPVKCLRSNKTDRKRQDQQEKTHSEGYRRKTRRGGIRSRV